MGNSRQLTKAEALTAVQALISGLQKHFPTGQLTVGNVVYASLALVQLLQGLVLAMMAQTTADTAARDALAALRDEQTQTGPVIQALKELLLAQFGNATQTLADFGLTPRKVRAPLTVEQKAAAKAKREATRIARGTMGPKAKLAIKGAVAAPVAAAPATATATTGVPVAAPVKPAT
jgi:hypothetical protein